MSWTYRNQKEGEMKSKLERYERTITVLLLALVILVPTSVYVGYQYAMRAGAANDDLTYGPGDVDTSSYLIFKNDSTYYAKSGNTRAIDYKGTNAKSVIQFAIDSLSTGRIYLKDATYSLGTTGLVVKANIVIEGESREGTIIDYTGTGNAISGRYMSDFELRDITVRVGEDAEGCVRVNWDSSRVAFRSVGFQGSDKSIVGQYGLRLDGGGGGNWVYYGIVDNCRFDVLNIGILGDCTGDGECNGWMVVTCWFNEIGSAGVDLVDSNSLEWTFLGGFWFTSPNAIGVKLSGDRHCLYGCQFEMGADSQAFDLDATTGECLIMVNDNCPDEPVDLGSHNTIVLQTGIQRTGTHRSGYASVADGGSIAHGLGHTPTMVLVSGSIAGEFVSVTSKDDTNFVVAIKKHDGTPGTSPQNVNWYAEYIGF